MAQPSIQDKLAETLAGQLGQLGYEFVHLEVLNQRQKTLRLFIDRPEQVAQGVTIEDCALVSRALDEKLDAMPEVTALFGDGSYELEVSSPGIDRPLRTAKDFTRFSGREARIHTFRPLTADELSCAEYQTKNPKQKNFVGILRGFENDRVLLAILPEGSTKGKTPAKKKATAPSKSEILVTLPLTLITKANLEPQFDPQFKVDERSPNS